MRYVSEANKQELAAILTAYESMMRLSWPAVHPDLARRRATWTTASAAELELSINQLMAEADASPVKLRVFWKRVPGFTFWGGNGLLAQDAGLETMDRMFGLTDFSKEVPWNRQAPLYRRDDEEVVGSLREKLDIVQRQDQTSETIYLHASKVPIRGAGAAAIGLMGAYTLVDAAKAMRILSRKTG